MRAQRILAAIARTALPRRTETELVLMACHAAWIRIESRRQERPHANDVMNQLRTQKRILQGYSLTRKRKLEPHELKPARHSVSRWYLDLYPTADVNLKGGKP